MCGVVKSEGGGDGLEVVTVPVEEVVAVLKGRIRNSVERNIAVLVEVIIVVVVEVVVLMI